MNENKKKIGYEWWGVEYGIQINASGIAMWNYVLCDTMSV